MAEIYRREEIMITIVFGTRLQYMKAMVLFKQLRKLGDVTLVDTGQHYDFEMSEIFRKQLMFPEVINLDVKSGTHGRQTARIMVKIEDLLCMKKPDLVVVIGDTNSTLGTTLASVKLNIPVGHVEAGCRTFNKIPEEINRVVVDCVSTLRFAPSMRCVTNLLNEGRKSYNTGDVLYDILLDHLPRIRRINRLYVGMQDYILSSIHRSENVDNPQTLKRILESLGESSMPVVLPLHPRTQKNIRKFGLQKKIKSPINMMKSVGYYDMINLIRGAEAVVTDSGGVQREAFWLRVPSIVLRERTEWTETVDLKASILVGSDKRKIVEAINNFPSFPRTRKQPYGDGNASRNIAKLIGEWL